MHIMARIWRVGRAGWTVMPWAPACRHRVAARVRLGMPRWRVLRSGHFVDIDGQGATGFQSAGGVWRWWQQG